jgi:serine/threonine-protein kinase HipA
MALEFYGRRGRMPRTHWIESATRLGVQEKAMARSLARIVDRAGAWAQRIDEIGFDAKVTARLARLITERCEELSR